MDLKEKGSSTSIISRTHGWEIITKLELSSRNESCGTNKVRFVTIIKAY